MKKIFYGLAIFFSILLIGSFSIQGIYAENEGMTADAAKALDEFLEQTHSPPLKQVRIYGVEPSNVDCALDLNLVFKKTDGSPACVKPKTAAKLIQRGWIGSVSPIWTGGCWPSIPNDGKDEFFLYYSKHEKGISGIFESISINATEKTITTHELNNITHTTKINDVELEKLWNIISEGDFFDLEKPWYPPPSGSDNHISYLLTICSGYIHHRVAWTDTSEEIPYIVTKIANEVNLAVINLDLSGEKLIAFPNNFDECVIAGGFVKEAPKYVSQQGIRCNFGVSQSQNTEVYNHCVSLGGGITVYDGYPPDYACSVYYYESGKKCLGNFCD